MSGSAERPCWLDEMSLLCGGSNSPPASLAARGHRVRALDRVVRIYARVNPLPCCSAVDGASVCYPTNRRPGVPAAPGRHSGQPRPACVVHAA